MAVDRKRSRGDTGKACVPHTPTKPTPQNTGNSSGKEGNVSGVIPLVVIIAPATTVAGSTSPALLTTICTSQASQSHRYLTAFQHSEVMSPKAQFSTC